MKGIFLIVFCITLVLCQDYGCTSWKDTILSFRNQTDGNVTLDIWTSPRTGWIGVGFLDGKQMTNTTSLFFVAYPPSSIKFYSNHSDLTTPIEKPLWKARFDNNPGVELDNMMHLLITVPYETIRSSNFIAFARNLDGWPASQTNTTLGFHTQYGYKRSPLVDPSIAFQQQWCAPTFIRLPGRIPAFHLGSFVPWMVFYVIVLILLVFFRNHQPIKSRGIGPYIATCLIMIQLMYEFIINWLWTYEEQYEFLCFTTGFGEYIFPIVMVVVPFVYTLRYISLLNISFYKSEIMKGKTNGEYRLPLRFRIMDAISSPPALACQYLFIAGLHNIMAIIIFSGFGWKCGGGVSNAMRIWTIVLVLTVLAGVLLLQLYDTLSNIKLILGCKWRKFFIETDHFYYRIEIAPSLFIGIVSICWIAIGSPTMVKILFCEMIYVGSLWVMCIFSLIVTIITWIRGKFQAKSTEKSSTFVDDVLADEAVLTLFQDYCQNEFSLENLYFKLDVRDFKAIASEDHRMIKSQEIINKFLKEGCTFEVNCSWNAKEIVNQNVSKDQYPKHMFAKCEDEVSGNLMDTYSRFVISGAYNLHQRKMQALNGIQ